MCPPYDNAVDSLVRLDAAEIFDIRKENYFNGSEIPEFINRTTKGFLNVRERAGETWAILPAAPIDDALFEASSILQDQPRFQSPSLEITLKNALPVPGREVPYEEILEFKAKRRDELHHLHLQIENIASTYAQNPKEEEPVAKALEALSNAISNTERVYSEKWAVGLRRSLSSAFILEATLPMAASAIAGLPLDKAFAVGVAVGVFKTVGSSFALSGDNSKPFAYVASVRKL